MPLENVNNPFVSPYTSPTFEKNCLPCILINYPPKILKMTFPTLCPYTGKNAH